MAQLNTMPEPMRSHLADLPCPTFDTRPWVPGLPLSRRRVAIISTAGLHRREDRPFEGMTGDYRVIPDICTAKDLVMTHVSTNFDRTGFVQDWNVVFPLGRPSDPAFQTRVILAALSLLETENGPVLTDFPDDGPDVSEPAEDIADLPACPVSFARPDGQKTDTEQLVEAFRQELADCRSWYDMATAKRGFSSVAYFAPEAAFEVFNDFLLDKPMTLDDNIASSALALRLAAQDLKTAYFESVMIRPDMTLPDDTAFNRWFWQKTAAGEVLRAVRDKCRTAGDAALKMNGDLLLVPMDQASA